MQTAILMNLKTVMPSERRHTCILYIVLFYYMKFPEKANLQRQKSDV